MALLFTLLLGLSAGILGYFLHDVGRQDFTRETEAAIDTEISMLKALNLKRPYGLIAYIKQRSSNDQAVHFRYEKEDGTFLAGTIKELPPHTKRLTEGILHFSIETGHGKQLLASKIYTFADGSRIVVARDIHGLLASYERLQWLIWLIMIFMLAVVLVSFGISSFVVSRINRIANTAQNIISTGDLSERISIDTHWDDLSNLAQVLNGFLTQIEASMMNVREVSNNIAHDLRTPLTSLRHEIESLKGAAPTEQQLDGLLAEIDRILSIFHSLLRIANIEKGKRYHAFSKVNLAIILRDVIDLYEPVAEEKTIRLQVQLPEQLPIHGDADLLFQLFANLLDNAIKFSPPHSSVNISGTMTDRSLFISIYDHGPGIPDAEKEHVFRHFYRGDASRNSQGHGLGLSLVKAAVEQHRGQITLEDGSPGLKVTLAFQPYQ